MTKLILKSEIMDIIPLCDDINFVNKFSNKLSPRLLKIIKLRHGHAGTGRLKLSEIALFIPRIGETGEGMLTPRHINSLYYSALLKIKELMKNE